MEGISVLLGFTLAAVGFLLFIAHGLEKSTDKDGDNLS